MNIARTWGEVNKKIVETAPIGILYKLFDGIARHTATPDDSLIGLNKEPDGKHLHSVLLNRLNQCPSACFHRHGARIFSMQHLWYARPVYIGIKQTYNIAASGKSYGKIDRYRGFAHTSLARMDGDDAFGIDSRNFFCGTKIGMTELGINVYSGIAVNIRFHSRFGSLHNGTYERVVIFVEDKRKTYLVAGNTYIVFKHSAFYQVFAVTRITDVTQGIYNLLRVHSKLKVDN